MKHLIILSLFCLFPLAMHAQVLERQVIGSAGFNTVTPNIQLNYTVGQTSTHTYAENAFVLCEGFQQGNTNSVGITEAKKNPIEISLFPNPANTFISFRIQSSDITELSYRIVDMTGKTVYQKSKFSYTQVETIPTAQFASGMYVIHISGLAHEKGYFSNRYTFQILY